MSLLVPGCTADGEAGSSRFFPCLAHVPVTALTARLPSGDFTKLSIARVRTVSHLGSLSSVQHI